MSLYWTDFSEDTLDAAPAGWTSNGWLAGELAVVADASAGGGKALKLAPGTNARRTAIWDLVGTDANTEVLIRARTPVVQTGNRNPLIVRQQNSGASLKGYVLQLSYTDVFTVLKYDTSSTTLSPTATVSGLNHHDTTRWYYVRYRVNGSTLRVRAWNDGQEEPTTWQLEVTDAGLASAGGVGVFGYYTNSTIHIDYVGVGTNGDTAPNGPQVSAGFTATPLYGPDDLTVAFTDTSIGATSWSWQFGDGQTSTQQNPAHVYTDPGTYNVTLTINGGAATYTRTGYITVTDSTLPSLSGDFEGGNINAGASSVTRVVGDYAISLVPRKQSTNYSTTLTEAWWYFGVRIDKMLGKRPTFSLLWTDWVGKVMSMTTGPKAGWVPCYSYTPNDPASWVYAPSFSYTDPTVSFQFSEAFTSDVVYVAYRPFCTPSMLRTWVDGLQGITNLTGKTNFVMGTAPATMDETGRVLPEREILGFQFGYGPAQMVITSGVHPCEDHGTQVMQSFVETLLASPAFLARYTVFCYPCVNPQGRAGRAFRGSFDTANPIPDPARDWTDTPVLSVVQQVRADIVARCAGGRPDVMLDFHGHYQHGYSHSVYGWNGVAANWSVEQEYQLAVAAQQPGLERSSSATALQPNSYFSVKAGGTPPGAFFVVEISDWLADQYAASRAFGVLLAGQLSVIDDNVYGRWPVGSPGALGASGSSSGVNLAAPAVANAVEYRFLRDGVEVRSWTTQTSITDGDVAPEVSHSYTYQARNPGGASSISAAAIAARAASASGKKRFNTVRKRFGSQGWVN